ncbi:hypothetical protein E0H73_09075 [Kribbella pittospori]|uniref:Transglycosylase SLT domain-containing protein n=1 Tax=Kribbella pittospori TaxID=722689 RepID=A0A4R0KWL7_9ACTN|nr:lytic murein transglycosylase [Kribbella pittospori]TCC64527.1 hypothetical protein E0H73_09075 [Kribbella pittospori]
MRVPKLIKARQRRRHGRHRRGRPAAQGRWQLAGAGAAVITLAALAASSFPDSPMTGGYDETTVAGLVESPAADPFIEDETLAEFVAPEQLAAVPVGPGRVAKPVAMVLSGAPVIKTLGESGIPEVAVRAYKQAEARLAASDPGCGVPWTLLAAIGRVESNHGRFGGAQLRDDGSATKRIRGIPLDGRPNVAVIRDSDNGALDGDTVYDRAVGPMQFIPSTWRSVNADGNGDGIGDPNNMFDAALGAAQYLCTGASNLRTSAGAAQAVRRYNNADSYVRVVLGLARMYQSGRVVGLPSTGELLPNEPAADPPALLPWPTGPSPALRPWPAGPSDGTLLANPAPSQRTEPAAPPRTTARPPKPAAPPSAKPVVPKPPTTSEPPVVQPPRPTTRPTPTDPQPTKTRPAEPKPSTNPSSPDRTRPPVPKPTDPQPSAPKPTQPSAPRTTEPSEPDPSDPTPSAPKPSEPKPSETDTSAPSTKPNPTPEPTTAAVGWAPAMRQVVGRTLSRPTCTQTTSPQTTAPQSEQPSRTCADKPAAPDDKNRGDNTRSDNTRSDKTRGDKDRGDKDRDEKNRNRCTSQNVCKAPGSPRTPGGSTR